MRGKGNLDVLINRFKVLEDGVKLDTSNESHYMLHFGYLMAMLPILLDVDVMVETGLGFGSSTRTFLEALSFMKQPRSLHTFTLETEYGGIQTTEIEKRIRDKRNGFKADWILHMGDSFLGGLEWKGPKIKLLYLDSDHSLRHVTNELDAWAQHMQEKAVIFSDDIWHENEPHAYYNTVTPGLYPTDVYYAAKYWQEKHQDWKIVSMSYPTGKVFLFRGFDLE